MSDIHHTGSAELIRQEPAAIVPSGPANILEVIARAATDASVDVGKMERLLAMYKDVIADQQRVAFAAALARLQAKLPQIGKEGRIVVKGTERSRYARIEDIDAAIRPILAEEGFSFAFDSESADSKLFKLSCKLSHQAGYSETKTVTIPLDSSEYRTNVQSIGSTLSYGKRYLIKMHLNLIERDEDDDGNGGSAPITEDQAKDIEALMTEVKADKARFLVFMGAGEVSSILSRDFSKAINALEAKRRK